MRKRGTPLSGTYWLIPATFHENYFQSEQASEKRRRCAAFAEPNFSMARSGYLDELCSLSWHVTMYGCKMKAPSPSPFIVSTDLQPAWDSFKPCTATRLLLPQHQIQFDIARFRPRAQLLRTNVPLAGLGRPHSQNHAEPQLKLTWSPGCSSPTAPGAAGGRS